MYTYIYICNCNLLIIYYVKIVSLYFSWPWTPFQIVIQYHLAQGRLLQLFQARHGPVRSLNHKDPRKCLGGDWKRLEEIGKWWKNIPRQTLSKMRSVEARDFLHALRERHKKRQDVAKNGARPVNQIKEETRNCMKLQLWSKGGWKMNSRAMCSCLVPVIATRSCNPKAQSRHIRRSVCDPG